ncbi:type II CRISPR-associated endonuclease Cas1 [Anaeromusa acidaminophila]|uniref:type II CRISPR-associated endonuclease Cas1 n=1 Tax=Anaeromusa acidaminophila TaxID=81464 RepID=UPI0003632AC2|nr:type II CRISPR-associated endonuclease Cas1 [Anaeromusa acidaminophila]
MSWRSIIISKPSILSVNKNQLVVKQIEESKIPLEDISVIILDTLQVNLTGCFLSSAAKYNIAVLSCDEKHMPCAIYQSFHQHSRQSRMTHLQNSMNLPLKKQIWKLIIKQKITNQGSLLSLHNYTDHGLVSIASSVKSGDKTNREAYAARIYFSILFSSGGRHGSGSISLALDYGYAILRSIIAQQLVAYGFIPSLGVFHHNELNAFNLADDLIEPYRPFVDQYVLSQGTIFTEPLSKENRQILVQLILENVKIKNSSYSIQNAIRETVKSLGTCFIENDPFKITLPVL